MKKIITTIILMITMLFSYSQETVEYKEEKVFSSPLLWTKLTRVVTSNGDTTYKYYNKNIAYPNSANIGCSVTFTKERLFEFATVALKAIENKTNILAMGYKFESGIGNTVYVYMAPNLSIQIYKKHIRKIFKEVS